MAIDKAGITREKILNAAIEVFARKGYSAATTSEIADVAGVAQGSVFRYFKTKKDILRELLMEFLNRFEEIVDFNNLERIVIENKNQTSEEFFKKIALNRLKAFADNYKLLRVIINEISFHEDIKELYKEKFVKKERHLENILEEYILANDEFKDYPYKKILKYFASLIFSNFLSNLENGESFKEIEADLDMLIEIFLNGIRKKD